MTGRATRHEETTTACMYTQSERGAGEDDGRGRGPAPRIQTCPPRTLPGSESRFERSSGFSLVCRLSWDAKTVKGRIEKLKSIPLDHDGLWRDITPSPGFEPGSSVITLMTYHVITDSSTVGAKTWSERRVGWREGGDGGDQVTRLDFHKTTTTTSQTEETGERPICEFGLRGGP